MPTARKRSQGARKAAVMKRREGSREEGEVAQAWQPYLLTRLGSSMQRLSAGRVHAGCLLAGARPLATRAGPQPATHESPCPQCPATWGASRARAALPSYPRPRRHARREQWDACDGAVSKQAASTPTACRSTRKGAGWAAVNGFHGKRAPPLLWRPTEGRLTLKHLTLKRLRLFLTFC